MIFINNTYKKEKKKFLIVDYCDTVIGDSG